SWTVTRTLTYDCRIPGEGYKARAAWWHTHARKPPQPLLARRHSRDPGWQHGSFISIRPQRRRGDAPGCCAPVRKVSLVWSNNDHYLLVETGRPSWLPYLYLLSRG